MATKITNLFSGETWVCPSVIVHEHSGLVAGGHVVHSAPLHLQELWHPRCCLLPHIHTLTRYVMHPGGQKLSKFMAVIRGNWTQSYERLVSFSKSDFSKFKWGISIVKSLLLVTLQSISKTLALSESFWVQKKTQSHLISGSLKLASFRGSPLVPMGKKRKGRAWYRFARDITARHLCINH